MSHTKNVADATRIICKKFHHRTTPRCRYTRGGTYLLHTSEYSSVPQLSERWRGYILWLRSSWNKSSLWGGLRFLRPSFMRFIEDSSLREEAGPREWRERDVLGLPVIRPYMGYLYLCSMVLAYLVMPCVANRSWFLNNFRHSSRELGEAGCSWIHLLFNLWKAPKASSWFPMDMILDSNWDGYLLICGLKAFRIMIQYSGSEDCYRKP